MLTIRKPVIAIIAVGAVKPDEVVLCGQLETRNLLTARKENLKPPSSTYFLFLHLPPFLLMMGGNKRNRTEGR